MKAAHQKRVGIHKFHVRNQAASDSRKFTKRPPLPFATVCIAMHRIAPSIGLP
jgi:hypothetical protein